MQTDAEAGEAVFSRAFARFSTAEIGKVGLHERPLRTLTLALQIMDDGKSELEILGWPEVEPKTMGFTVHFRAEWQGGGKPILAKFNRGEWEAEVLAR
jgi:hypothetical protein